MYSLVSCSGIDDDDDDDDDDAESCADDDDFEDGAGFAGVKYAVAADNADDDDDADDEGGASGSVQRAILSGAHTTAHRSKSLRPPRSAACLSPMVRVERNINENRYSNNMFTFIFTSTRILLLCELKIEQ